ncbi:hypothetical protein QLX08_003076 [Tetragonisca angustula]|uniref:Uncharacterized protein n=1 Tax=Tetragonisca angustula TaxID=166442 RepID=A0AAW1A812_9HYME
MEQWSSHIDPGLRKVHPSLIHNHCGTKRAVVHRCDDSGRRDTVLEPCRKISRSISCRIGSQCTRIVGETARRSNTRLVRAPALEYYHCPGVLGASTTTRIDLSSCFLDGTTGHASDPLHGACAPVSNTRETARSDDDDVDTPRGTTLGNEVRASTLHHGYAGPVCQAEATMRSEGTGTATTGSSQNQRRIAVEL